MVTLLAARIRVLFGWTDSENGQALIEYSLIMCLVVIVILVTPVSYTHLTLPTSDLV